MYVELMNEATANLIATFTSEREALAYVRTAIDRHGRSHVDDWALGYGDESQPTLAGGALAERALALTV